MENHQNVVIHLLTMLDDFHSSRIDIFMVTTQAIVMATHCRRCCASSRAFMALEEGNCTNSKISSMYTRTHTNIRSWAANRWFMQSSNVLNNGNRNYEVDNSYVLIIVPLLTSNIYNVIYMHWAGTSAPMTVYVKKRIDFLLVLILFSPRCLSTLPDRCIIDY